MSNVYRFPKDGQGDPGAAPAASRPRWPRVIFAALVRGVWVALVLVWPVLKWVVSIEVFFQAIRMIYHWDTPGVYAGWTFVLHFAVFTALTYFVSIYKPRGI